MNCRAMRSTPRASARPTPRWSMPISARLYLRDHAGLAAASLNYVTDNLYAIATQSRRPEISVAINEALQAMIDDGTLRRADHDRWL